MVNHASVKAICTCLIDMESKEVTMVTEKELLAEYYAELLVWKNLEKE